MLYEQYTIGGELMHSAKGVEWKNKKYIDKVKTKTGKWRYIYKNKNNRYNYQKMLRKHGILNEKNGKKKKYLSFKEIANDSRRETDTNHRYHEEFVKYQDDISAQNKALNNNFDKNFGDFSKKDPWEHEKEPDHKYNLDRRRELLAHLEKESEGASKKFDDDINKIMDAVDTINTIRHPVSSAINTANYALSNLLFEVIDELDRRKKKK